MPRQSGLPSDVTHFLSCGVNKVLLKPLDMNAFVSAMIKDGTCHEVADGNVTPDRVVQLDISSYESNVSQKCLTGYDRV